MVTGSGGILIHGRLTETWLPVSASGLSDHQTFIFVFSFLYLGEKESVLVTKHRSWLDAQAYCRLWYTDLVSVLNMTQNRQLTVLLQDKKQGEAWIGLHRHFWWWSDGSKSTIRAWATNEPTHKNSSTDCAAVSRGYWFDRDCYDKLDFVCQSKPQKIHTTLSIQANQFTQSKCVCFSIYSILLFYFIPASFHMFYRENCKAQ